VSGQDSMIAVQHESRRRFLELVADLRPELHRYCARMTGSVPDGEDIVQETLARAYYLLPEMDEVPAFRPWLFRIAHNRALDHLRRYEARMGEPLEAVQDSAADPAPDPGDAIAHQQAVQAAVSRFVELAPAQRSCVILKDVLGHSLEEIGGLLELSLPAVKAALHRGRVRLRELAVTQPPEPPPPQTTPAVARYVALFNARDWDGVRAMLAGDVQLDLVSRAQRAGRAVGNYLTNYDRYRDWRLAPAWMEGREVIAVFRAPVDTRPGYFIELDFEQGKIRRIRDFRYVPYVMQDAVVVLA
jgi:RNA polymerase sigma factor (sigma-70 family)